MPVLAYINFNGNCREAVDFYADAFEAEKQKIMTYGDVHQEADFELNEEAKKLVMHTFLDIMGSRIMFSDVPPGMPFIAGNNIALTVVSKDIEEVKNLFDRLKEGGTIIMELQETFWSKCYGYLTDKFGIGWQLSHDNGNM